MKYVKASTLKTAIEMAKPVSDMKDASIIRSIKDLENFTASERQRGTPRHEHRKRLEELHAEAKKRKLNVAPSVELKKPGPGKRNPGWNTR